MNDDLPPPPSVLPKYVAEPLQSQGPERLEAVIEYANELIEYRRRKDVVVTREKKEDSDHDKHKEKLESRGVSTDPDDYEAPPNAYITTKNPHGEGGYYYWQWREGESWLNEYIAPVNPKYNT